MMAADLSVLSTQARLNLDTDEKMPRPAIKIYPRIAVGETFDGFTVVVGPEHEPATTAEKHLPLWTLRHTCGATRTVSTYRWGREPALWCRSCTPARWTGTKRTDEAKAAVRDAQTKHGMAQTPEFTAWVNIRQRCYNPKNPKYPEYGGRQITVCDRWRGENGFENFYADMGDRPSPKHSIDRYPDNDGNYEPDNCRWATATEQARNKRNTVALETSKGKVSLREVCERIGADPSLVVGRVSTNGWALEDAITRPRHRPGASKRHRVMVDTPDGFRPLIELARDAGMPVDVVRARISQGWPLDRALSESVVPRVRRPKV